MLTNGIKTLVFLKIRFSPGTTAWSFSLKKRGGEEET